MYESGGGIGLGIFGLGLLFIFYVASSLNQLARKDDIAVQQLQAEIKELNEKVGKYENEIYILVLKTQDGKNPQLLRQLEGKPEKLEKLKTLINEKISAVKSATGS